MKKTILLVLLAFLGSILFADPFGLKMGMTLAEIAEKCSGGKEPEYVGGGSEGSSIMWIPEVNEALKNEKLDCVMLKMKSVDGEKKCCELFYMFENSDQAKGAVSPF